MSEYSSVMSAIPEGSVLVPVLFIILINDPTGVVDSERRLFADDTKLHNVLHTQVKVEALQEDMNAVTGWSRKWQLPFNENKCKVVHSRRSNHKFSCTIETDSDISEIENEERDLGVLFDTSLLFSSHAADIARRANMKLGIIKRSFSALGKKGLLQLYKTSETNI